MPELSQISIGGVLYDIKDNIARQNTSVELDTEMLDDSENGVQNKVIKAYVDETVKTEVTIQIEETVQDTVQETIKDTVDETVKEAVDKAIEDALSGGTTEEDNNDEIDSWF